MNYWLDRGAEREKLMVGISTYCRGYRLTNPDKMGCMPQQAGPRLLVHTPGSVYGSASTNDVRSGTDTLLSGCVLGESVLHSTSHFYNTQVIMLKLFAGS